MTSRPGLLLAGLVSVTACGGDPPAPAAAPYVLASFYPLTYFANRIAQGTVEVGCPLPPDTDPVTWRPDRHDVELLQQASLVLINGASFEQWVDKVSLPQSRVVDTSRGLTDRLLTYETVTHSHGAGGAHTHTGTDGHTWLDPNNAKVQSRAVHDALAKAFPAHVAEFAAGLARLDEDLDALHSEFQAVTAKIGTAAVLASHPAYNYLASRYGWQVRDLHLDPGAQPSDADVEAARAARGSGKAVLLWETEPTDAMRTTLSALGVESVVFSPCETTPPAGVDYLAAMRANLQRLAAALDS
ncbi:MAG: metal ABC transporter substrate-binding protein [Planctomycetota bacterium]